jgi:hypothetical protein
LICSAAEESPIAANSQIFFQASKDYSYKLFIKYYISVINLRIQMNWDSRISYYDLLFAVCLGVGDET